VLEATAVGPIGDISYPDSAAPPNSCGASGSEPCTDDPFLVLGASKYDTGGAFDGWIDDLRFSWWLRYLDDFTPPMQPLVPDGDTVALFNFNEGSGQVIYDTGAFDGGASTGTLYYGGSPAGPAWTTMSPFVEPEYRIFFPLIAR
jgi:hypothetical protein